MLRPFFRHWRVTVPVAMVALLLAVAANHMQSSVYQVTGDVYLADPAIDPQRTPKTTLDLSELAGMLTSPGALQRFADPGATVQARPHSAASLEVTVTATSAVEAERSFEGAVEWLHETTERIQREAGAAESELLVWQAREGDLAVSEEEGTFQASQTLYTMGATEGSTNPYDAGHRTMTVLHTAVNSEAGRQAVLDALPPETAFTVTRPETFGSPLAHVTVTSRDDEAALTGFDHVVAAMDAELDGMQARAVVAPHRRVFVDVAARPRMAQDLNEETSSLARAVAIVGLGAALTTGGLLDRRQRTTGRKARGAADETWQGALLRRST